MSSYPFAGDFSQYLQGLRTPQATADPWAQYQQTATAGGGGVSNSAMQQRAANLTNAQKGLYEGVYVPATRKLVDRLNDTSLIDRAKDDAGQVFKRGVARQQRELSRYGLNQNAVQQRENQATRGLRSSQNYADIVNNAVLEQSDRRQTLRDSLIDLGRGIQDSASSGISDSAAGAADREQAYQTNKTQANATKRQQNASMAGMAIMAIAMM